MRELSAGTEIACAPGRLFGRAFRASTASSQACFLRDVMYTFEQPAWRRLQCALELALKRKMHCAFVPMYSPRGSVQSQPSGTARHDGNLSLEGEDVGEIGQLDLFFG